MMKITIPFGRGGKVEIEGSFEEVKKSIDQVDSLFEALNTAIGGIEIPNEVTIAAPMTVTPQMPQQVPQMQTGMPQIPTETKKSVSDAIVFLLKSPWGMQGKDASGLNEALEKNMIYKSMNVLTGTLSQLAKSNKVNRRKETGKWVYYPAN